MDKKSIKELLDYILFSIKLINDRFKNISKSEEFVQDATGLEKLDAISMRIQTIGESIKNILKRNNSILTEVKEKGYWNNIVKFREIVSHHYIDIDAEIVFDICKNELKELEEKIREVDKNL